MITHEELMNLLSSDVLDNRLFVVEYAMAPYWNKRIITNTGPVLRGFFCTAEDIIYSAKEFK